VEESLREIEGDKVEVIKDLAGEWGTMKTALQRTQVQQTQHEYENVDVNFSTGYTPHPDSGSAS
jgi:hypothetical protein